LQPTRRLWENVAEKAAVHVKNALLIVASMFFSFALAEGAVRYLDGYAMFHMPLSTPSGFAPVDPKVLDQLPVGAGVRREWFFTDPPALPNRGPVPADLQRRFRVIEANAAASGKFLPEDALKTWNAVFAADPCNHRFLHYGSPELFVYDPPDGGDRPPYRYLPDVTFPSGLVTNQVGWRGRPIEIPRGDKTVRLVFVGASVTVDSPYAPFSWPEFAGHWLNTWATSKGLDVRFEVLNAAREGVISSDIAAIVRTEILPVRPDLVVYYEGGNQFRPASIVDKVPKGSPPELVQANTVRAWLQTAARYSALLARVEADVGAAKSDLSSGEWPKPDYKVVWPEGLDEADPDLSYSNLPVNLTIIQRDLDRIRGDLATVGSELALSSFMWLVKEGMVLDPIRHRYILEQLNVTNYPFRYRDLERLAKFQNRLLAKYAKVHGLPFVDIAGKAPFDPSLFLDAIHTGYAGSRAFGWIAFNELLPMVQKHLADGSWPRPWPVGVPNALPAFTPRQITFHCRQ
jgi:hypothetical protein